MGAPLGNQNAVGHGRPREIDYSEQARLLDEWSLKPTSVCLYDFTFDKTYLAQDLTDFAKKDDCFSLSLKKAKERIARNRLTLLSKGDLHQAAWNRSASLYDKMLREHEREIAREKVQDEQEIRNAQEANKKVSPNEAENAYVMKIAEMQAEIDKLKQQAMQINSRSEQTI